MMVRICVVVVSADGMESLSAWCAWWFVAGGGGVFVAAASVGRFAGRTHVCRTAARAVVHAAKCTKVPGVPSVRLRRKGVGVGERKPGWRAAMEMVGAGRGISVPPSPPHSAKPSKGRQSVRCVVRVPRCVRWYIVVDRRARGVRTLMHSPHPFFLHCARLKRPCAPHAPNPRARGGSWPCES